MSIQTASMSIEDALRIVREQAPERAAAIVRDLLRDKSYQLFPIGQEAATYLRAKRKRLTDSSYRDYEGCLDKLARYFPDIEISALEPPIGVDRIEEFLDDTWGKREPRTYNKNLSILGDFFEFHVRRGTLHGDPTTPIERARTRQVYRTTFSNDQRRAIIASADELRDRIALRLLLDYGIRKGSLQAVQFKHFDHQRRRLTIFAKGGKVREIPIPHPEFWLDLDRHFLEIEARGSHFLMAAQKTIPRAGVHRFPDRPMSAHGMHRWWYRKLTAANVVEEGTSSGERMHKARHTAGQRVLDATGGNIKAVQKLLGHKSLQTTADVYTDWDVDQLTATMLEVLAADE